MPFSVSIKTYKYSLIIILPIIKADDVDTFYSKGNPLRDLAKYDAVIECYD